MTRASVDASHLTVHGIDAETGEYLVPPRTAEELAEELLSGPRPEAGVETKPLTPGIDPRDLGAAGWGIVLPETIDPAARDALEPLVRHRRDQAGDRCRILTYREGDTAMEVMDRAGGAPGVIDPAKTPYYLMLVGSPDEIPFAVQYELGASYAVGRLDLENPEGYATYSRSVIDAETGRRARDRRLGFVGTSNPGDEPTQMSSEGLVAPLAAALRESAGKGEPWEVETWLGAEAGKERYLRLLGEDAPALLFSASHGTGYPCGHPRQREGQGALVCQDWPGPASGGVRPEHLLAAGDISDDADVGGLIAFLFACYGAGTPELESYGHQHQRRSRKHLAPAPMVARLPQRLLSHPGGSALAVIGHVDLAWAWSFVWGREYRTEAFEAVLRDLTEGLPVGAAMEHLCHRYTHLAAALASLWERQHYGEEIDRDRFTGLWTAANDARAYVILGDPAVTLAMEGA